MTSPYAGLPEPPVPEECTMGNNDYFPLYFRRLRKSRWWRGASDLARSRNIDLWGEAYEQQPAGSLPDDDIDLADAAGFGRDVASFQKVKAEILTPWILCSDGRWYHPTVCEVVLDLWEKGSVRRKNDAQRAKEYRDRVRQGIVTPKAHNVTRDGHAPGVTTDGASRVTTPEITRDRHAEERIGEERTEGSIEPVASASPEATSAERPKRDPWDGDDLFATLWNACGALMRRRAKSRSKVWPECVKAKQLAAPLDIVSGLGVYMLMDPDVKRTGGPGLHIWLKDRAWETWGPLDMATTTIGVGWDDTRWSVVIDMWRDEGRWDDGLGPKPGQPGCRAPGHLLISETQGAAA